MKRRKHRLSEAQREKNRRKFLNMVLGFPNEFLEKFHAEYPDITFENAYEKIDLYLDELLKEAEERKKEKNFRKARRNKLSSKK